MLKRLSGILSLLLLLTLFSLADVARADPITINFEDVGVGPTGIQQIANDRYTSQGLYAQGDGGRNPFVVGSGNGATSNFLFGGTSPDDPFRINLYLSIVLPGTNTLQATDFITFDVVSTGDTQNGLWQVIYSSPGGYLGETAGHGSGTFSFSTEGNLISNIWLTYSNVDRNNNLQIFTGRIGIDNLRYNSPTTPAPEPATLLLLGTGITGIGAKLFRRRKAYKEV
ncbi:MAG TPA: PEP-CTERM sorting domain-containing protein [Pyrinomonadaceae bacterium]|nr:PEP-CTERM sorting domain-containing protein [Pyrinomonadaceae bacterium]